MAEWKEFEPAGLLIDGVDEVLAAADPLISALDTSLNTLATVVEVAGAITGGMMDAQQALIDATNEAIDAVVQQLTQTGVYWLFHTPPSFMSQLPPSAWCYNVGSSLQDYSDANRPILPQPAFLGGLAIVAVSDNYGDLMRLYEKFFALMGKITALADQMNRWPDREDPWQVIPGVGTVPNWRSKKLGDVIPPLGELAKTLLGFKEIITGALQTKDLYDAFAEQLRQKAAWLTEWAEKIYKIIAWLTYLTSFEGAWILPVYGEFTGEQVFDILVNSTGGPRELTDAKYTAGTFLLATGGTSGRAEADALFDLFRIPKEITQL